jgi:hypothetical protein
MLRKFVGWLTLVACPVSLTAADTGAAMLHAKGTTWVNGSPVPAASAVFPGDMVQTEGNSAASISSPGSSVSVLPGSLVKFEASALGLEHGSINVATSKKLVAKVGGLTVTPASDRWTEFQVRENNGKVQIIAQNGDVKVSDDNGSTTVPAGQQTTRDTHKNHRDGGAAAAAGGGLLDSPIIVAVGGAGVGALVTWVLLQGGKPYSPSVP